MPDNDKTILLVEDDIQLLLLLSTILKQAGYSVRGAADGFAALAELRIAVPDILLSDLYMAGMSGFELLSVVRRRFPRMCVVAMSSAFTGTGVPRGIAADAFYAKASRMVDLLQLIQTMGNPLEVTTAREPDETLPIWLDVPEGEMYINMICLECLRAFPLGLGGGGRLLHETCCVHCHSRIHYSIVESSIREPHLMGVGLQHDPS